MIFVVISEYTTFYENQACFIFSCGLNKSQHGHYGFYELLVSKFTVAQPCTVTNTSALSIGLTAAVCASVPQPELASMTLTNNLHFH